MHMEGHIVGFDEYMNIVLDDAEEVYVKTKTRKQVGKYLKQSSKTCCLTDSLFDQAVSCWKVTISLSSRMLPAMTIEFCTLYEEYIPVFCAVICLTALFFCKSGHVLNLNTIVLSSINIYSIIPIGS